MSRRILGIFLSLLVFLLCIDWPTAYYRTVHFIFQERDVIRALELLKGHLIFFGPEMTGGGNLPGPLYYFLLALPLSISVDWLSPWLFMMLLAGAAGAIGWHAVRTQVSAISAAVWLVMFGCAANVLRVLMMFLNISFIFVFAVPAFAALLSALVSQKSEVRRNSFWLGAFLSGLAIQLHFSTVTFLLGFLLAQVFAPWLKVRRIGWAAGLAGFAIFLLPLLPYWAFRLAGQTWGQEPFFAGEAQDAVKSLALLVEFAWQFGPLQLSVAFLQKLVDTVPWVLLPAALAVWIVPVKAEEKSHWVRPTLFLTFVAAVPFCYWTFATIGIRYAMVFNLAAIFLAALTFGEILDRPRRIEVFNYIASALTVLSFLFLILAIPEPEVLPRDYLRLVFLVGAVLILVVWSEGAKWLRPNLQAVAAIVLAVVLSFVQAEYGQSGVFYTEPRLMPPVGRWLQMWRTVYEATGWSYEESMRRLYFVNHHLERDGRMTYDSAVSGVAPTPEKTPPDGFFIAMEDIKEFRNFTMVDTRNWILLQNIPEEIKEAIRLGEIRLGAPYTKDFIIIPYSVDRPGKTPRHFHNNGQGYFPNPGDLLLGEVKGAEGVKRLSEDRILFKWNDCPSLHRFCDTGAVVSFSPSQIGTKRLFVEIYGSALSQVSPWISPTWSQRWLKPFVEIRCGGRDFHFPVAESVGYSRLYSARPTHVLLWGNNSIVAPLDRDFEFPCSAEPSQISFGYEGSQVDTLYEVHELPAARLSIHL